MRARRCSFAHSHKPLISQHRFDHDTGTVTARHHQFVRLDQFQQTLRIQISDDLLTCSKAVHALIHSWRVVIDLRIQRQDTDLREVVPLTHCIVIEIMRRGDLHAAGTEGFVDIAIGNHRNFAIRQRQFQ